MPCLQSQKEEIAAEMGKDVATLFPLSSTKADELSDSDVPDLDYIDCLTNLSKVLINCRKLLFCQVYHSLDTGIVLLSVLVFVGIDFS